MNCAVLGLGETLKEFTPRPDILTIGVNDIYREIKTDHVVCVDPPGVFHPDRMNVIRSSTPIKFFSFFVEWELFFPRNFSLMKRNPPRSSLMGLNKHPDRVCYSICSPYVACVKAYQMGSDEIVLYGVDFKTHEKIKGNAKLAIIQRDFTNLYNELKKKNVNLYVGTENSFLSTFIPLKNN